MESNFGDIGMVRLPSQKGTRRPVKDIITSPETREVDKFYIVHSKDRDTSLYPSPSRYRIDVADMHGALSIKSVSLHSAILPNCNSILDQPYLLLNVEELQGGSFDGTNSASQKAIALLMMDKPYDMKFINIRTDVCRTTPQKATQTLKSMAISITDQYGAPFDFGLDVGNSINDSIQHTLVFKFTGNEVKNTEWYS